MKKEDITALVVYVLMLALAIVFGFAVLRERQADSSLTNAQYIGYVIGGIVLGVVFNSALFELAHMAGAKVGRYAIISVNILGLCWYKNEQNKTKFKLGSYDGLTGETKIVPLSKAKKEPNPIPFLLFGSLFFVIEFAIAITLFVVFNATQDVKLIDVAYFIIIVAFVGLMIYVYNIIPTKLDSITDGYRLTLVTNPKNKVAFNELLRVEREIALGNKDVQIKTFDQITNFTADLNLNKVYVLLDQGNYDEALPIIRQIAAAKQDISSNVYTRAMAQIVFILIMTSSLEDAVAAIDKEVDLSTRRSISKDASMVSIRAYILLAGLIDKSKSECVIAINSIQSAFKRTPETRKAIEIKLFNLALDKIIEKHPDWEFDQYRLKDYVPKTKK